MKKRIAAGLAVLALVTALSGCGEKEPTAEERLLERVALAKICLDAGGSYEYDSFWGVYQCKWEAE